MRVLLKIAENGPEKLKEIFEMKEENVVLPFGYSCGYSGCNGYLILRLKHEVVRGFIVCSMEQELFRLQAKHETCANECFCRKLIFLWRPLISSRYKKDNGLDISIFFVRFLSKLTW